MGGADGFVGFLGAGGFGFVGADFEVVFAEAGLYKVRNSGDGVAAEADGIGAHIGNMASLVEALGGAHGGASGKAEFAVGFNLEGGGSEWRGGGASAGRSGDI